MHSPLQIEVGSPADYRHAVADLRHHGGMVAAALGTVLSGVLRRVRSSSGEDTWRAAWAVCDKRLDCRSRIVARHDRTHPLQGSMVGGGHAFLIPRPKHRLHPVLTLCWPTPSPAFKILPF